MKNLCFSGQLTSYPQLYTKASGGKEGPHHGLDGHFPRENRADQPPRDQIGRVPGHSSLLLRKESGQQTIFRTRYHAENGGRGGLFQLVSRVHDGGCHLPG